MSSARILIVEDDTVVAELIQELLQTMGYLVPAIASSKEAAIQQVAETRPDLVLMDIELTGKLDGVEAAEHIQSQFDIPVVYLTAHADEESLQQAKLTEPFGYILKPFTERELHTNIEIALYKHEIEKKLREHEQNSIDRLEHLVAERTAELRKTNEHLQQEIIERKRAEQALRASEQRYRLLAENVADGVVVLQEGNLVFVNQVFASMLGYSGDWLLQNNPFALVREDYREDGKERIALLEKQIGSPYWQAPCMTGDGREIWVETYGIPVEWEGKLALLVTVRNITERKLREIELEQEQELLRKENITLKASARNRYRFGEIIGKSPAMQDIYELLVQAAVIDEHVLIYGESGTGKELIARTIHQMSDRRDKEFVPVNCGAIPDTLFESAMFGYRKGAFTGAYADQPGFFDLAHQGTLFLDEIGELSPAMQVKLLRALEGSGYTPVGSHTTKKPDIRIIAATNRNPVKQLHQGTMREDFFYRIHVIAITVPPLRERKEDIPLLIDHFLEQYGKSKTQPNLPGEILEKLYRYDWPGNVRELQNMLHRYFTIHRLDFTSLRSVEPIEIRESSGVEFGQKTDKLHEALEEFEKHLITKVLDQHNWRRAETATALGIPTRTLHRKMTKHHLTHSYPSRKELGVGSDYRT
jgi:PAS domain S-box-containing protein